MLNVLLEFSYQPLVFIFPWQPVGDMDNSDEDSQNSSENSFNEMVTAPMARGYAYMYML